MRACCCYCFGTYRVPCTHISGEETKNWFGVYAHVCRLIHQESTIDELLREIGRESKWNEMKWNETDCWLLIAYIQAHFNLKIQFRFIFISFVFSDFFFSIFMYDQVYVCPSLANLYENVNKNDWRLKFTGVPGEIRFAWVMYSSCVFHILKLSCFFVFQFYCMTKVRLAAEQFRVFSWYWLSVERAFRCGKIPSTIYHRIVWLDQHSIQCAYQAVGLHT